MKSWVEISEERLAENYARVAEAAGDGTAVLAVIKANAYGHGAAICAPVLARAGAHWLGVTDVAEGEAVLEALRAARLGDSADIPKILVMSGLLCEDADAVVTRGLVPVVWDRDQLAWLAAAADRLQHREPVAVHLEIDTGMARQGVAAGAALDEVLHWIAAHPQMRLDGVLTHFAAAEVAGSAQTRSQRGEFERAVEAVGRSGLHPAWVHAGNSSTVDTETMEGNLVWLRKLASTAGARAMVRSGLALYGYCLPVEGGTSVVGEVRPRVRPVMTWKTRVIGVREVPAGGTIGYNGIFSAERAMRVALLPIGYADGLRRELSASNAKPGGWAMVRGKRAGIVGRVSMNLTTLDVTGIPGVAVGDEAIVLGDGTTADDHARLAGTIAYEIVCGVRAPGKIVLPDGPPALSQPANEDLFAGTPIRRSLRDVYTGPANISGTGPPDGRDHRCRPAEGVYKSRSDRAARSEPVRQDSD